LGNLAAEAVQRASLVLKGVDHVHGGDGLPARVLDAGRGVADDVLEKHLERIKFFLGFRKKLPGGGWLGDVWVASGDGNEDEYGAE